MSGLDCISVLKAMAEESRMRIVRLLLQSPLGVNTIAEKLGLTQYNVSKHLRVLREAGLLEVHKQGKQHLYALVPELSNRLSKSKNELELKCCTFRFDKLPK